MKRNPKRNSSIPVAAANIIQLWLLSIMIIKVQIAAKHKSYSLHTPP